MKQELNGNFPKENESYYDYISRRYRETRANDNTEMTLEQKIVELTERVKQLEMDMAHVINSK